LSVFLDYFLDYAGFPAHTPGINNKRISEMENAKALIKCAASGIYGEEFSKRCLEIAEDLKKTDRFRNIFSGFRNGILEGVYGHYNAVWAFVQWKDRGELLGKAFVEYPVAFACFVARCSAFWLIGLLLLKILSLL
jgi:hypothetical protein